MDEETKKEITKLKGQLDELQRQFEKPRDKESGITEVQKYEDIKHYPLLKVDSFELRNAYYIEEKDNGNSGTAITMKWNTGNKQKLTLTGNCTITMEKPSGACSLILKCVNFGAHTPTFAPVPKWVANTEPIWTASGTDILALYFDGTNYYGSAVLNLS